ncbi:hypothetical protein ACJQWK_03161 [Exserohilum turcicum]
MYALFCVRQGELAKLQLCMYEDWGPIHSGGEFRRSPVTFRTVSDKPLLGSVFLFVLALYLPRSASCTPPHTRCRLHMYVWGDWIRTSTSSSSSSSSSSSFRFFFIFFLSKHCQS